MTKILDLLIDFIKERFDLSDDAASAARTIDTINQSVEFQGTNLWALIFAIIIASIGLNLNSPAIIIGAMLISPLMGPIVGIGLGMGIYDFDLIKRALKNLLIAVIISVMVSALFFSLSPLSEAKSELLARTTPTLYDVFIALAGGLAGIVAGSRKNGQSNVIAGVAIATALMPPLCTAGYAIANFNWFYLAGSLYLFSINGVFISISTFVIVRFLKYPRKKLEAGMDKRVQRWVYVIAIATAAPSVFVGYTIVRQTIFVSRAQDFIKKEMKFPQTSIVSKDIDSVERIIDVTVVGERIQNEEIETLIKKLTAYRLEGASLLIRQGSQKEFQELNSRVASLEKSMVDSRSVDNEFLDELKTRFPSIVEISIVSTLFSNVESGRQEPYLLVVVQSKRENRPPGTEVAAWMQGRLKAQRLRVAFVD